MLRPALVVAALVAVALLPSLPAVSAAAPPSVDVLDGAWALAQGRDAVRSEADAAIERAVGAMFVGFRAVARPQLRKWVRWCEGYSFHVEGDRLRWSCDDGDDQLLPLDGGTLRITGEDGRRYEVEAQLEPLGLRIVYTGEDGGQRDYFRVDDRGTLVVTRTMFSKRLPEELSWTVRYRRR